jgi:hypothetical protein
LATNALPKWQATHLKHCESFISLDLAQAAKNRLLLYPFDQLADPLEASGEVVPEKVKVTILSITIPEKPSRPTIQKAW